MESIIKDKIVEHLQVFNLINDSQHGFMKGRSCLTNLLEYLETVTKLLDEGVSVDVIYLDFAKAFDKVPHARLLKKLEAHGIEGDFTRWIKKLARRKKTKSEYQWQVIRMGECDEWCPSGFSPGAIIIFDIH